MNKVLVISQLPKEAGGTYTTGIARVVENLYQKEFADGIEMYWYFTNVPHVVATERCTYEHQYNGYQKRPLQMVANILCHPFRTIREWKHYKTVDEVNPVRLEFYKASKAGEKRVVLLTTFNNTLNDYTTDVFQQADIDSSRMNIITMDRYCCQIYYRLFGSFNTVSEKDRIQYISTALQNHYTKTGKDHRFYHVDDQYWCDEFLWIKQKNINTLQGYQEAERTGRGGGVRITREERRIVFELFQEYCAEMKKHRKTDLEDIYIRLIEASDRLAPYKYKYVLVDEAQDLSFVKLKVAKLLANDSITIAADKAQKIYNTGFTWKEIGIDVRGNASKTLHKTFRSTKQIVQLAESLSEVNRYREGDKGEYTDPVLPTILGEDYPFIIRCSSLADEKQFLAGLISGMMNNAVTIGLLYRNYSEKQNITSMLLSNRIGFEEIKKGGHWSLRRPGVKLVTLHSSKGLEFDVVIIPYFNAIYFPVQADIEKADKEQVEEIKAKERNRETQGDSRSVPV